MDLSVDSPSIGQSQPVPNSSQSLNYRSRVRTEPTNFTAPQWTAALWERLEYMTEDMAAACIKVRGIWGLMCLGIYSVVSKRSSPLTLNTAIDYSWIGIHSGKGSEIKKGHSVPNFVPRRGDEGKCSVRQSRIPPCGFHVTIFMQL